MDIAQRLTDHFGGVGKGGVVRAAHALGIGKEALRLWRRRGIPLSRALAVERVTAGAITAEEIIAEARARKAV